MLPHTSHIDTWNNNKPMRKFTHTHTHTLNHAAKNKSSPDTTGNTKKWVLGSLTVAEL